MNTKEAIDKIKNLKVAHPYPENIFRKIPNKDYQELHELINKNYKKGSCDALFGNWGRYLFETIGKDLKPIIEVLERGEKYKQMCKKLREDYGEYRINCEHMDDVGLEKVMDNFEQKNFPKGGSQ